MSENITARLEYLRGQLRAECISYGELADLQGLAGHIDPGDTELLEAAGVPEFPDTEPPRRAGESLMDLELLALDTLAAAELAAEHHRNTKAGA